MRRGELWWASLPEPAGSGPGLRRPVLIISADAFNRSGIQTIIAAAVTSNIDLAEAPGNVRITGRGTGLDRPSVVNVSQLITADKSFLTSRLGRIDPRQMRMVDEGLRLALALE
jgi:mRNA interferase MazF